jgi:hypothetical protein
MLKPKANLKSPKLIAEREEFEKRVREEFADFSSAVMAVVPTEGHEWSIDRNWDSWFSGDLVASIKGTGTSVTLRKTDAEANDPDQLHVEVRLFRGEVQEFAYRPISAIVWAERGARIWMSPRIDHIDSGSTYRNCLPATSGSSQDGSKHLYADSVATMRDLVVEIMTKVMKADQRAIAAWTDKVAA